MNRLEQYSWRGRETHLNTALSQYRTAITLPNHPHPLRVHFLHVRSPHKHAVPLLLIPSFPSTNLSPLIAPLFKPLTQPDSPTSSQPFHLVVPSIPGLGFSDAFQSEERLLESTAELFAELMKRLGYEFFLTSGTGSGRDSPAGLDYHLSRMMGDRFPWSCLGTHLIDPLVERPRGWAWVKFAWARLFDAEVFGYTRDDFEALRESQRASKALRQEERDEERRPLLGGRAKNGTGYGAISTLGLREPNTFAYALCDSPVGLLSLVCCALRKRSPNHTLSNEEIVDVTQMAWLPGPEAGMRFWSAVVDEVDQLKRERMAKKARVAITVFGSDGTGEEGYTCPAWARQKYNVLFAQRLPGKPGLVAWERTEVVVEGIRGLAREVHSLDGRLKLAALEEVVVGGGTILEEGEDEDHGLELDVESPDTVVAVDMG